MLPSFCVAIGKEGESKTKITHDIREYVYFIDYSLYFVEKRRESEQGKTTCFKIETTQKYVMHGVSNMRCGHTCRLQGSTKNNGWCECRFGQCVEPFSLACAWHNTHCVASLAHDRIPTRTSESAQPLLLL